MTEKQGRIGLGCGEFTCADAIGDGLTCAQCDTGALNEWHAHRGEDGHAICFACAERADSLVYCTKLSSDDIVHAAMVGASCASIAIGARDARGYARVILASDEQSGDSALDAAERLCTRETR